MTRLKAIALVLVASPLLLASCSSVRAKAAFQDGNKLYKVEQYKEAIVLYQKAVDLDPNLAEAWFYLANSYQALYRPGKPSPENTERLEKALSFYKKSLELNQADSAALKGVRYNTLAALIGIHSDDPYKSFEQAIGYAQELVKENPEDPKNLFALGGLYEKFGKIDEAEKAYQKAVEVVPNDVKAWNALATFYNKAHWNEKSRFDDAIKALEQAAGLAPNDPLGYYKIATFYWDKAYRDQTLSDAQKLDYAEKGMGAVDKSLAIQPDYCDGLIYKGLLLRVKAQVAANPRLRAKLLDEADAVRKMAVECKKQAAEAQAPVAAEAPAQ